MNPTAARLALAPFVPFLLLLASACEQVALPAPSNDVLTPEAHTAFVIASGAHAVSCNICHGGFPSFKQFTCFGCHGHEQDLADGQHKNVAEYSYESAACYSCHQIPRGGTGTAPPGAVHDPGKDVSVHALVPTFAGTSIGSLYPEVQQLPMPMDHATTQVVAAAFTSCAACHADARSGVYFPGTLHSALANLSLAQPTGCSDCHLGSRPTGFVGPTATSFVRSPPSGEMKHDSVAWSDGQPTAISLVTQDCSVCHASPSGTLAARWGTGLSGVGPAQFHSALTAAAKPQPASCLDCHANSRPTSVLTSANAALPVALHFDHQQLAALGDCAACHGSGASHWTSWQGGRFHLTGGSAPSTCLPCHEAERPTSTAAWKSTTWAAKPFDTATNALGITHGDGQDCALCHKGPGGGAWGGAPDWTHGDFVHGPTTVSGTTCIACHMSQRPDLQPGATAPGMATLLGFDHSVNGTGNCFGCHQATISAGSYADYANPATQALPGGDWKGGQAYPGSTLIGSATEFITITELALSRSGAGNLITGVTSTSATLYNEMLHISTTVPAVLNAGPTSAPDNSKCWHCHTNNNGTVTLYAGGKFHDALTGYRATPGGAVSPFAQPTTECADCHTQMRPVGIVQKTGSDLLSMDHSALFTSTVTIGGAAVSGVSGLDCSVCHHSPGATWTDGSFHHNVNGATPRDCTLCHYPLMADAAKADVASGAHFVMRHRASQLTFQSCQTCHTGALAKAADTPLLATLWQGGAYHASVSVQPAACVDCHSVSTPAPTQSSFSYSLPLGGTATNVAQWMSHASSSVVGKDCALCHATDAKASGSAWSKSVSFHALVANPASCQGCHGLANGNGSVPGANNNLPAGLTNSSTQTTASSPASTGVPAGTFDQLDHADVNASGHDCNFCHTQAGRSTAAGVQGKEWAQAKFHQSFGAANPLVANGTTGRCSHCHMNLKPGSGFGAFDHSPFSASSSSQDCAACHSWPGTGAAGAPNWLGAGGMPQYISVGGFTIPKPPASSTATQGGIANLSHPTVATGTACTTCHATAAGGKNAHGYPHTSSLGNACNACHEAGSNLLGTPWNNVTSQSSGAGDSRPFTLTSVVASKGGRNMTVRTPNHFYPVNCSECHVVPSGNGAVTTGSAYANAWTFPHNKSRMTNSSTCNFCH